MAPISRMMAVIYNGVAVIEPEFRVDALQAQISYTLVANEGDGGSTEKQSF
ncbi:MAG: hypothetical protein RIG68_07405 [Imperialibacter sp.]|uniref:hypothetical protein n=1 Tax=Imperialibacter sp. TaxID=2038411 RepID=UPI0032EB56A5